MKFECFWSLYLDKRIISNITSHFQVVKYTANVLADSEQILQKNIVLNKSLIEIRLPNKLFHPSDSLVFPKSVFGMQNWFCNSKWFKLYPWLDYDSVTRFVWRRHHSKLKECWKVFFTGRLLRLKTCSFYLWCTPSCKL